VNHLASTETEGRRVSFDLSEVPDKVSPASFAGQDVVRARKPFVEPTDFSKTVRLPRNYFARRAQASSFSDSVSIDDFLRVENGVRGEEDVGVSGGIVPNLSRLVAIVRNRMQDGPDYRTLIKEVSKYPNDHLVLLLARPLLEIGGVYIMEVNMRNLLKIWGFGPRRIDVNEVHTVWMYSMISKEFKGGKEVVLHPRLDAVSV
jgi:hypothetical protein